MQKALSSDLKTAAAPAGKKYPLARRAQTSKNILSFAVAETFGKCPLARRAKLQKISVPSEPSELSENIPSFAFPKIRRKIRLNRRTRNFREISAQPPFPKFAEKSASTAVPETFGKIRLDRLPETFKKTYSCPPCPKAENFHILYML